MSIANIFWYWMKESLSSEKSKSRALIVDLNDIMNMYTKGTTFTTIIPISNMESIPFLKPFAIAFIFPPYSSETSLLINVLCINAITSTTRKSMLDIAMA